MVIFGILMLLLLGGSFLWWRNVTSPVNPQDTRIRDFTIETGDNIRNITTNLKEAGLIKNQVGFFIQIKMLGLDSSIQAGNFRLSPAMKPQTIAQLLTHGVSDVRVTIMEGLRNEEVAALFSREPFLIPETSFLKEAREGYLFPDTYDFTKDATEGAVIAKLTENFNQKITDDIKQKIAMQDINFDEGLVLASIVEKEGRTDEDRPVIAGILLKRLKNDWPLQADATLQYALGYQKEEQTWWKKELTTADKKVNSPYNTYINVGLPPQPICNPGLMAIQAVAEFQGSDYWYYLHDAEGQVHYAKTLEEHEANIAKYLNP